MRFVEAEDQENDSQREDGQSNDVVHAGTFLGRGPVIIGGLPPKQIIIYRDLISLFGRCFAYYAVAHEIEYERAVVIPDRFQW